ncbi:hypothetical protein ACHAXR_003050 [Thalassiosira sp. AJA248-18]
MAGVTTTAAAPTSQQPVSYHRGDPLDIPLIDGHLLTHLLLPRITSAIKLAFPRVYLDWTTGATASGSFAATVTANINNGSNNNASASSVAADARAPNNETKNTLVWKRIVEGLLRTFLLLGSCHHFYKRNSSRGGDDGILVSTPAMQSLGMFLRPSIPKKRHSLNEQTTNINMQNAIQSRLQAYGKIISLVLATVIVPSLYEELKHRRQMQLEDRDRQLRLDDIRREFRSSMGGSERQQQQQQQSLQRQSQHSTVQQRAQKRKSILKSLLADMILGVGDVLLPPLRLINYISYLWGVCSTPNLGMVLAGWEYASVANPSSDGGNRHPNDHQSSPAALQGGSVGGERYQRHANFQYGNRRLLVEEALRTVSTILPPRVSDRADGGGGARGSVAGSRATVVGAPRARLRINERGGNGVGEGIGGAQRMSSVDATSNGSNRVGEDQQLRGGTLSRLAQTTVGNNNGWMRKRFLSFMGVAEDENVDTTLLDERRYSLTCSMCHVENPTVPYIASCGHCYCYLCLRLAVTDDLSFRCVDCGKSIVNSGRPKSMPTRQSSS